MSVQPIPRGYHTVTPYLVVPAADEQIDFVERALGGTLRSRHTDADGRVMHAEVEIGDSVVMIGEASEKWPSMPSMLHLYVEDCDRLYARAVEAGATSVQEPTDQFYGDRMAAVKDAAGNQWWMATHIEDVPPEELERRMTKR